MVNMAASASTLLLLLSPLLLAGIALSASTAAAVAPPPEKPYDPPTVPELMDRYLLPRALLPDTARRYLLKGDGAFQLFLDDGCLIDAGGYRIAYDVKLSGAVAPGKVTGLKGVRVRVLFAWVPITGVEVGQGAVTVSVGFITKSFPVVGFKSSPRCAAAYMAAPAADA